MADTQGEAGSSTATSPLKAFWGLWSLFWLLMICVSIGNELHHRQVSWWEPVVWEGSSALVSTAWMWMAVRSRRRYARYLDRPLLWFARYLSWLPLIFLTWIGVVYGLRNGLYAWVGRVYEHPAWGFVMAYESLKLTIFSGLWLGVLFGVDSYDQWQLQRYRLLQTQKLLADAQLSQLRAQLRPHFLFNALNTISALMHADIATADRLVAALGDLLRISLREGQGELTSLVDELRSLELYADIMCQRFRDRVQLEWRIETTLQSIQVPVLILQPLLENAFKHGVESSAKPVLICIQVLRMANRLQVNIRNTGQLPASPRTGMGLANCRERLKIVYGDQAVLELTDQHDMVLAGLSLPLSERVP